MVAVAFSWPRTNAIGIITLSEIKEILGHVHLIKAGAPLRAWPVALLTRRAWWVLLAIAGNTIL